MSDQLKSGADHRPVRIMAPAQQCKYNLYTNKPNIPFQKATTSNSLRMVERNLKNIATTVSWARN